MQNLINSMPFVFVFCGVGIVAAGMGMAIYSRNDKVILSFCGVLALALLAMIVCA
jgi:hypothetical protein